MSALFREEVSQRDISFLHNGLALQSGPLGKSTVAIAILFLAGLFWLLSVASVARKAHVPGYLLPGAGIARVTSPRIGVVSDISVSEGQYVDAGEPLLVISAPRDTATGVDVDEIQVSRLRAEAASIDRQTRSQVQLEDREQIMARQRAGDLRAQIRIVEVQIASAKKRAELMRQELDRLRTLRDGGHVASDIVDTKSVALLEAEQAVQSLVREKVGLGAQVEGNHANAEQSRLQAALKLEELRLRALGIQRSIAEAEAKSASAINAPISGRVTSVTIHSGMSVSPQQTLLAIVPVGSALQAELLIPTRAAGFVHVGQAVKFRYDAFPYQKFGLFNGTINSISRAVLMPEDQNGPVHLNVPAYRAVASVKSQALEIDGNIFRLQPGLLLQADIIREERTLMEWLFEPVVSIAKGI